MIWSALHFNASLSGPAFTSPSDDLHFVQMLQRAGCNCITVEIDPIVFTKYQARYATLFSSIKAVGLQLHIINQMNTKGNEAAAGVTNPLYFPQSILPPSFSKFSTFEANFVTQLAQYQPDHLSVIAELVNLNQKMRTGFSVAQYMSLITTLCNTVKSISPYTKTWIDLTPTTANIPDPYVGNQAISIPTLDGIGWDIYGNPSDANGFILTQFLPLFKAELAGGKMVGATETWYEDMWAQPQYDDLQTNLTDRYACQNWFGNLYHELLNAGVPLSMMNPFFTNDFLTLNPLPNPLTITGAQALNQTMSAALSAGTTTTVFQAYQQTIAGNWPIFIP